MAPSRAASLVGSCNFRPGDLSAAKRAAARCAATGSGPGLRAGDFGAGDFDNEGVRGRP